jgi:flagellar hook protein FlgE
LAKFTDSTSNPTLGKIGVNNFIDTNGYVKPNYDASKEALNMAGGKIRADAKTEFNVIDSLGNDHEIFVAFKKIATMKYAVEVYTAKGDVNNGIEDGLIAAGKIKFDSKGKGEIEPASAPAGIKNLEDKLEFKWADEGESLAGPNNIKINWNKKQMYDDNQLINIDSNGKKGGILQSTSVDDKGNLTGYYTNGDQKKLAAIPVAIFKDPLKLENEFGTIFSDTTESGKPSFKVANLNGAGKILSGNLEGANVDETKSMTDLMKQHRFYSYNAKSYGMMNNMEDVLLGIIRV